VGIGVSVGVGLGPGVGLLVGEGLGEVVGVSVAVGKLCGGRVSREAGVAGSPWTNSAQPPEHLAAQWPDAEQRIPPGRVGLSVRRANRLASLSC
jgi:hypothetical protein